MESGAGRSESDFGTATGLRKSDSPAKPILDKKSPTLGPRLGFANGLWQRQCEWPRTLSATQSIVINISFEIEPSETVNVLVKHFPKTCIFEQPFAM
jgi:hypothetical protein